MECPYCGAELIEEDSFGNIDYICYGDRSGKRGDIYKCPNEEGFEEIEDVIDYILNYYGIINNTIVSQEELNNYINKYLQEFGLDDITEVCCESFCFNGFFYTYENDCELHEGYPC